MLTKYFEISPSYSIFLEKSEKKTRVYYTLSISRGGGQPPRPPWIRHCILSGGLTVGACPPNFLDRFFPYVWGGGLVFNFVIVGAFFFLSVYVRLFLACPLFLPKNMRAPLRLSNVGFHMDGKWPLTLRPPPSNRKNVVGIFISLSVGVVHLFRCEHWRGGGDYFLISGVLFFLATPFFD